MTFRRSRRTPPRPRKSALKSDVLLERLTALHPKLIDLSLGRVERLLADLGHPERHLPPAIHVAGTNGKGSAIAFMRAALEAAGYRVHVYTSPHLVHFHERIRLAGRLIEEEHLATLLAECEAVNAGQPITFFEITTAVAFLAFARTPADMLLLESGLGGRLDATNVLERPALDVITPVSIDHTQHLGEGLEAIAAEKAGILKPGVTAVLGPQPPAAAAVIAERAVQRGSPLVHYGVDYHAEATIAGLRYVDAQATLDLPRPALPGPFQRDNAATAVAALRRLEGFDLDAGAIATGLRRATLSARLQRLHHGPLVERLPEGWELWLDAGHNPAAGVALAAALRAWADRPLALVVGMLTTKDAEGFLCPLANLAAGAVGVAIPGEAASFTAEAIAAAARAAGLAAGPAAGVDAAVDGIVAAATRPGRILICGSIYLAGTVLAEHA